MTDISTRVEQYVKLRDTIKKMDDDHKEKMKPYRELLEELGSALLGHLNNVGAENVKTAAGTFYKTTKKSASIADGSAFWAFVVSNEAWDLIDKRANATAVEDFIKENSTPPPGVSFNTRHEVGVRRA